MFLLSTSFDSLGRNLSSGLAMSWLEISLTVLLFATISLIIRNFIVNKKEREQRDRLEGSMKRFMALCKEYDLSEDEIRLLRHIAENLPKSEWAPHKVLLERGVFNRSAAAYLELFPGQTSLVNLLRARLKFQYKKKGEILRTTSGIPEGKELKSTNKNIATVVRNQPEGLELSFEKACEEGSCKLFIKRPEGLYSFEADLSLLENGNYLANHSDLKRIQRRKYFRAKLKIEVEVERFIAYSSDLSGGGVKLHFEEFPPPIRMTVGKAYQLHIHLDSRKPMVVYARLLSENENEFIFKFSKIRLSDQDRLIQKVLKNRKR